jgi:hypothetical protein
MDMSPPPSPPLLSVGLVLFVTVAWSGPIGLVVLRRQLADASGARLAVKTLLVSLTVLTAPATALMLLIIIVGFGEAAAFVGEVLKNAW